MPSKKSAPKKSTSSSRKKPSSGSDRQSKQSVHDKMETVMHEWKHHELKSSSGDPVRNPKQAIAIALSEARRSGAAIPPNPNQEGSKGNKPKGAGKSATAKKMASPKRKSSGSKSSSRKVSFSG